MVARDKNLPDIGYHYDCLDVAWSSLNLSNTLTLSNGVAVAVYGASGLILNGGAILISEGSPVNLNRIVRYNTVQELPSLWGASPVGLITVTNCATNNG